MVANAVNATIVECSIMQCRSIINCIRDHYLSHPHINAVVVLHSARGFN